ncbi:MAG: acylphosphatase [Desulfobacteraceae bacterium]
MGDYTRLRLIIEGRVQGVFFRDSTRMKAEELGVKGWVRNRRDGTVEVVAEGPEDKVLELAAWCRQGPRAARVERVQEIPEAYKGEFASFSVTF